MAESAGNNSRISTRPGAPAGSQHRALREVHHRWRRPLRRGALERRLTLGTNPWTLAVLDSEGGVAISIDQSASVVAKGEVIKASRAGKAIPIGWALGPDGQPTTDAAGSYKGVNSAILVEVMAACLSGATLGIDASPFSGPAGGPPRTGQGFVAIDPRAASGGVFAGRIAALRAAFAAEPGVHVPGAGRRRKRQQLAAIGVAIDRAILDKAVALVGA